MLVQDLLSSKNPDAVYLQTEKTAYSYAALSLFVRDFKKDFLATPHEMIALQIQDQALLAFCIWACIQQEQSFVLLPFQIDTELKKQLLSKASCNFLITSQENLSNKFGIKDLTGHCIREHSTTPTKLTVAKIGFVSSGTTGTPKLIWNTFAQLETSLAGIHAHDFIPYSKSQCVLLSPFLTHSYGFSALLEYTLGNSTICLPSEASFAGLFRFLSQKKIQLQVTAIEGVPYFYKQLVVLQKKIRFQRLQHVGFGGDFVHDPLLQSLRTVYPEVSFSIRYGISEIPSVIGLNIFTELKDHQKSYTIHPDYSVTVGEEIVVHTNGNDTPIYTGDVGFVKEGRLFMTDRKAVFIKVKGYKVSPNYIESVLLVSEMVDDAKVFAKNDALIAQVIPLANFDKVGLKQYLRSQLPPYALPDIIKEVETIARTNTGKISRQ